MKKRANPRKDFTQVAFNVLQVATGEAENVMPNAGKDEAFQSLGRRGGKARAAKLTPEHRKEIAKKAAQLRWVTKV